jgi:hypothetical protein
MHSGVGLLLSGYGLLMMDRKRGQGGLCVQRREAHRAKTEGDTIGRIVTYNEL